MKNSPEPEVLSLKKVERIKGIIFDFGGTLIYDNHNHFEQANAWMLANFLRSRGFNLDPENFTQRLMYLRQNLPKGDDNFKQVNTTHENLIKITKESGIELSGDFLLECEKVFVTPEVQGSILLPEIVQVLEKLSKQYRIGLISNTRSHLLVTETLKAKGLETFFNPIVTSVSAGYRKPSPKVFQTVLDTWQLPANAVVMIGDSLFNDISGAKAVEMQSIWLTTDTTETGSADAIAKMPQDILEFLLNKL